MAESNIRINKVNIKRIVDGINIVDYLNAVPLSVDFDKVYIEGGSQDSINERTLKDALYEKIDQNNAHVGYYNANGKSVMQLIDENTININTYGATAISSKDIDELF